MALTIRTASGTSAERRSLANLQNTINTYDITPWTFTDEVLIEEGAFSHSHPVLTLSTRNTDGEFQLASFLHEQIHWFCDAREADTDRVALDLKSCYPDVPVGRPEGARTEESTYLHLIVCWLEIDALARLAGQTSAERIATHYAQGSGYAWIYRTVLADFESLGQIYARHDLCITQ